MKFDKILSIIKIGIPPLIEFLKVFFKSKRYTKQDIDTSAREELSAINDWRKSAEADRAIVKDR